MISGAEELPPEIASDSEAVPPVLAALIEARGDRFDPIRLRRIQALARKAQGQPPAVALALEDKARQALSAYQAAQAAARTQAAAQLVQAIAANSAAADELGLLFDAGDFRAMSRLAARMRAGARDTPSPLVALTRTLQQRAESRGTAAQPSLDDELRSQEQALIQALTGAAPARSDMPDAMRRFRETLVQGQSQRRVTRALRDGPENPGPLNSEALVIRSLAMMRDLSPSYTQRLIAYLDSLLWLQQAGRPKAPAKPSTPGRRKA